MGNLAFETEVLKQKFRRQRGKLANAQRGNCQAVLRLKIAQRSETVISLPDAWAVAPTEDLLTRLERLFGDRVATLA